MASIVISPQKVVLEIEQLLRAFLWSGAELKGTGAKVSWKDVCVPKEEGGLGFRLMKDWNRASMAQHLWAVCKKSDTLWVKWIHTYIIKDKSIWGLKIPPDASWTVRKILKLRDKVGNGIYTFLWLDDWHLLGPLYQKFGDHVMHNLGRSLTVKVCSIIQEDR